MTLVENTSDHGGQSVTVSWNFLDSDGEIVKSESHLQSFSFPGQTIAVITQVSVVEGVEVASIEPTLLIEDLGYFPEGEFDLGIVDATIRQNARTWSASFPFENPTSEILQSPSADIVCWDAEGTIIGGGFEYPDLVPANGEILVDATLLVSGEPATCKAFSEARCSVPDG